MKNNRLNVKITLFAIVAALCATVAFGQDAGAATEAVEAAVPDTNFLKLIAAGGWAMWPLGFLSLAGAALTLYNFFALKAKDFYDPEIVEQVGARLAEKDFDGARQLCNANSMPITRVIVHGLESVRGDSVDADLFRQRMEASSNVELAQPFVIINYLSIIASISPMLGLLGTVSGMVKAFTAIATVGMGQPALLAGNISEALITTATGMVIGIPTMFFFFFFKNTYGKIVAHMTMYMEDVYGELVHASKH